MPAPVRGPAPAAPATSAAPAKGKWTTASYARLAFTLLLAVWGRAIYVATAHASIGDPPQSVLHNIILPIHESGHIVFMAFGEFMHALGGSLFQILFPLIFVVYFFRRGDKHAATIPLWFAGISAIDVVPYIKDAPWGELELIGGEHDWAYLLGEMTQTHHAEQIGNAVLHFGALCLIAALVLGIYWIPKSTDEAA